jgi:hypothetical protein
MGRWRTAPASLSPLTTLHASDDISQGHFNMTPVLQFGSDRKSCSYNTTPLSYCMLYNVFSLMYHAMYSKTYLYSRLTRCRWQSVCTNYPIFHGSLSANVAWKPFDTNLRMVAMTSMQWLYHSSKGLYLRNAVGGQCQSTPGSAPSTSPALPPFPPQSLSTSNIRHNRFDSFYTSKRRGPWSNFIHGAHAERSRRLPRRPLR